MSDCAAWAIRTAADRAALEKGYYWDQAEADRIIRFAERYVAHKYAAKKADAFRLFPWQKRFLQRLYGWRRPDGRRRFRKVLLHVPKKNGKTLLVAVIAAFELLAADVEAPLVVSCSTTKENAKQVYDQLVSCINRHAKLSAVCQPVEYKKIIKVPKRDGEYRALSADAPSAEGANASVVILDEAHAHKSPDLYRTLEYAMIGRENGFMVIISTAGEDELHWYFDLVERGRRILAGDDLDPSFYAEIYEADHEQDNLDDPAVWHRSNPSLGLYPGFDAETFALDWESAKGLVTDRLSFERYRFNIFRSAAAATWIDAAAWSAARRDPPADLGRYPVYLGFAASTSPCALAAVSVMPAGFYLRIWAWVTDRAARDRAAGQQKDFEPGSLVRTPGESIDQESILAAIAGMKNIKGIALDPTGAWLLGPGLKKFRFDVQTPATTCRAFNGPARQVQAALADRRLGHDGNAWALQCVQSVRLESDAAGLIRPSRAKSADLIDAAVATILAFGLAASQGAPKPSVYEGRGLRTL